MTLISYLIKILMNKIVLLNSICEVAFIEKLIQFTE